MAVRCLRGLAPTRLHQAGAAAALLGQLPDKQRLPIQPVKLQGLSVAEAASQTGLSESAVKVGVHRGLKVLAARIREHA
jgi:RNA polymerase sigma-70 factor (ECF subfamily)